MAINTEVASLSAKATGPTNPDRTTRLFNAGLTILDAQEVVRPYLAEGVPQLNTDTWQVLPDGRMETIWRLRSGLSWHDGPPLVAEDFAFAVRVYKAPELVGLFEPRPQNNIERIAAVDATTFRIYWRAPYLHQGEQLNPLPRHLLAEPFAALEQDPIGQKDAFKALRYWTVEYVGAGPYRLISWERTSYLEGAAFDGHALGRPKIDRIELRFINNNNTVLANLMAGEVHIALALGAIAMDNWQRAGIDAQQYLIPQAFILDVEAVSTYPGTILETVPAETFSRFESSQIAAPANRWRGNNRGGWSNPEFDELVERYDTTIDLAERTQVLVQLTRVLSDHVPSYPISFNLQVVAHWSLLKGPQQEVRSWNIHEWEWQ